MSKQLDQADKDNIQENRMNYTKSQITKLGYEIFDETQSSFKFKFQGEDVIMFPFTGWFSGKKVKDGRGFYNLKKQLLNAN